MYISNIKDISILGNLKSLIFLYEYICNISVIFPQYKKIRARMKVDSQVGVSFVHNCFNVCYNSPNSYNFDYNKGMKQIPRKEVGKEKKPTLQ